MCFFFFFLSFFWLQFIFSHFGSQLFRHDSEMPFPISILVFFFIHFLPVPTYLTHPYVYLKHFPLNWNRHNKNCTDLILLRGFCFVCSIHVDWFVFKYMWYVKCATIYNNIISFINREWKRNEMKWKKERQR